MTPASRSPMSSRRDILFFSSGVALGLLALAMMVQIGAIGFLRPKLEACTRTDIDPDDFAAVTGHQPYDDRLGFVVMDSFVCVITQFFHDVATSGMEGTFIGYGIFITALPVVVLMALEAGRPDARGLIRYPMLIALACQVVGVSVTLPLLWFPAYILGRGKEPLSQTRILFSVIPALAFAIFAILTFSLEAHTSLWTTSAGILGGPAIVLSYAPLWAAGSSPSSKSAQLTTMAYLATGAACFLFWLWLLLLAVFPSVGVSPTSFYKFLWLESSLTAKVLLTDWVILWVTGVVIIAYQQPSAALEAVGLSCLFGPGAGLALVLAGLQVQGGQEVSSSTFLQGTKYESPAKKEK